MTFNKLSLRDELLRELGEVCVSFSFLENSLVIFIKALLNNSDHGDIVTAELSIPKKITLLMSLFRYCIDDEKEIQKLKDILDDIGIVSEERNMIFHSSWSIFKNEIYRRKTTAKYKKGLHRYSEPFKLSDLRKLNKNIDICVSKLRRCFNHYLLEYSLNK